MHFKLVLVERVENSLNTISASSGLLFDDFVIVTANIFAEELSNKHDWLEVTDFGNLHLNPFGNRTVTINCVLKNNDGTYDVKSAKVFAVYFAEDIKKSEKYFKSFSVDTVDNNRNLNEILSTFFILSLNFKCTLEDFKRSLKRWWNLTGRLNIKKCDKVYIESAAFADRNFLNSVSQGIVSNILGENSCFILSDCPSTPGSEGSPVYIEENRKDFSYPVGIVLSSVSFWRGEWTGLTIIADIRNILIKLIDPSVRIDIPRKEIPNHLVVANCEFSLVQIYSGTTWGTAVLLDSSKGIFITNSHVVIEKEVILHYRHKKYVGRLVYQTHDKSPFDLAVVECRSILTEKLKPILVSKRECRIGETIYSAGFSLFPKEVHPTPTLTKGCITKIHQFMLKTTCSVHAGSSGGAILDESGHLIGIIVCNTKLNDKNAIFPRMNMAIPYVTIVDVLERYIERSDVDILKELGTRKKEIASIWNLEGKL